MGSILGVAWGYVGLAAWTGASTFGLAAAGAHDPARLAEPRYAPRVDLMLLGVVVLTAGFFWVGCSTAALQLAGAFGIEDKDLATVVAGLAGYVLPLAALAMFRPALVAPAGPPSYQPVGAAPPAEGVVLDYQLRPGPAAPMGLRRQVGLGVLGILLTAPWVYVTLIATEFALRKLGVSIPTEHEMIRLLRGERGRKLAPLIVLSAGFFAPAFEELLFRGMLQSFLATLFARMQPAVAAGGRLLAITITSVLFALMHPRFSWPAIFALSLGLGYLYERTGRMLPVIVMHAIFNLTSLALTLTGWS